MKADALRKKFLDFFKQKKHKIVDSDSLIPKDDPTVLFTPAGMNQFKKEFLGKVKDFRRIATCQRCLRTDDLDKVGKTSGHHTFFEMLGNFSFGDYFKKEAIAFAWEFLTEELKIDKGRLWVSIYREDEEAFEIWKNLIKIPEKKIIRLGDKENFWPAEAKQKGPNGPCGPCSEIFFDWGIDAGCKKEACSPACDCGRFVEVWNLVFTQYNRRENGLLEPLPNKNIDTGMGLERLTAVMQGVKSNFETDLFKPLIAEITNLDNVPRGPNTKSPDAYAIADHIRAIVFAIYDGVLPSNEERGYVVRKIIRRSILHLRSLGIKGPFLYKLVPVLAQIMQEPYPDLQIRRENIAEIILAEEKNYISTLDLSDSLLNDKFANVDEEQEAGRIAFQLYDTYGIPYELSESWLKRKGKKISFEAFNLNMHQQKARSKEKSVMKGDVFNFNDLDLKVKNTKFLGYKQDKAKAKVLAIVKDGKEVKKINKGESASVILDKTPFYPESGGQVGDTGFLLKGKAIFEVEDTKKSDKVFLHSGKLKDGSLKVNDEVMASIDAGRRLDIARNHTATHLLQGALRKVLGFHVQQQGSLVAPERLRFDFTHFKNITKEEISRVEEIVNNLIMQNLELSAKEMPLAGAKKTGALAFFQEKYDSKVRVVSVGEISKELCAGTHLKNTGGIGLFKIVQEGSISSGIRRIEAVTGKYAYKALKEEENILSDAAAILNVPLERIPQEIEKRVKIIRELEKAINSQKIDSAKSSINELINQAESINSIKVITGILPEADMNILRNTLDMIKARADNSVIALGSEKQSKALLVMGITEDLCKKGLDASKIILEVAGYIGGSGGGRKDFAQAGGEKPQNFTEAFNGLKEIIRGFAI